jgi:hypothetical protein
MRRFRILALDGGGARGLFQAHYLHNLRQLREEPLWKSFDLIAGTSVGAINGLMIALDIDTEAAIGFYSSVLPTLFTPRRFRRSTAGRVVFAGPVYDISVLLEGLSKLLGDLRLSDCKTQFISTTASFSAFTARMFTNVRDTSDDRSISAVDVALASAAAPSFFEPVTVGKHGQTYLDGGVWANSPSLAAILFAHDKFHVPFSAMRVLSLGTGAFPTGSTKGRFSKLHPLSKKMVNSVLDLMFATQADFASQYSRLLVGDDNFANITCQVPFPIALDDALKALSILPGLAEEAYSASKSRIAEFISGEDDMEPMPFRRNKFATADMITTAGLSRLVPARKYYSQFRGGAGSISEYLDSASSSLTMVSINLRTGHTIEDVSQVFERKLTSSPSFAITISLLNPSRPKLIAAINDSLSTGDGVLAGEIENTIEYLLKFKRRLPEQVRRRFGVRVHNSIPFASAILLDMGTDTARIQLETKAYKAPLMHSFALEFVPGIDPSLFQSLAKGYADLIQDGESAEPTVSREGSV